RTSRRLNPLLLFRMFVFNNNSIRLPLSFNPGQSAVKAHLHIRRPFYFLCKFRNCSQRIFKVDNRYFGSKLRKKKRFFHRSVCSAHNKCFSAFVLLCIFCRIQPCSTSRKCIFSRNAKLSWRRSCCNDYRLRFVCRSFCHNPFYRSGKICFYYFFHCNFDSRTFGLFLQSKGKTLTCFVRKNSCIMSDSRHTSKKSSYLFLF